MELLQLRYFCAVAESQNMSKTAQKLFVSQPALSKTITKLEAELGVELFDRVGKQILLNENGELFYARVKAALNSLDEGAQTIRDSAEKVSGKLVLIVKAAINSIPMLIDSFKERYPNVEINLLLQEKLSQNDSWLNQCNERTIYASNDFSFEIYGDPDESEFDCSIPLLTEEMVLAVPCGHELAHRDAVSLSEAASYHFTTYYHDSSINRFVAKMFAEAKVVPRIISEASTVVTQRNFLNTGLGLSIAAQKTMSDLFHDGIVPVHIHGVKNKRSVYLNYDSARHMPKAAKLFKSYCIDFYREI